MGRRVISVIALGLLCMGLGAAAPGADRRSLMREQRTVVVGGASEEWLLAWAGQPSPICRAEEMETAMTCPCEGWAYGETGDLWLIRRRGGREIERMRLGGLFGKFDYPAAEVREGDAYLQRWPPKARDPERAEAGDPGLLREILRRPAPRVIQPVDYDHDGEATEFLIQVGVLPCGKRQFAAVGVSRARPRLHALGSATHPDAPLILPLAAWQALARSARPEPMVIWPCDDHGSEVESVLTVSASGGVIRAVNRDYGCPSQGDAGRLVRQMEW